jgi:hypothetical protein
MKLNLKAFALASGIALGGGLMFLTIWTIIFEGQTHQANFFSHIYRGYDVSYLGSVIGLAWGLVDGAASGFAFGWLYNKLVDKFAGRTE